MQTKAIDGLTLFFDAEEGDAADLIGQACEQSMGLIQAHWGLEIPQDLRVYVMTCWRRFFFHSAPWPWRLLLAVTMPLWSPRVKRTWVSANGWAQGYGKRQAVGIKPPHLVQVGDRSAAERIFFVDEDKKVMIRNTTCHELVHAFTAHLKLPMWLNEGLANVTVDHFAGRPTIQPATIETLGSSAYGTTAEQYRRLRAGDLEGLVYHVVRGYWLTRYLEDTQPELLRSLLARRHSREALESRIAATCGLNNGESWIRMDSMVASHFKQE